MLLSGNQYLYVTYLKGPGIFDPCRLLLLSLSLCSPHECILHWEVPISGYLLKQLQFAHSNYKMSPLFSYSCKFQLFESQFLKFHFISFLAFLCIDVVQHFFRIKGEGAGMVTFILDYLPLWGDTISKCLFLAEICNHSLAWCSPVLICCRWCGGEVPLKLPLMSEVESPSFGSVRGLPFLGESPAIGCDFHVLLLFIIILSSKTTLKIQPLVKTINSCG